MYPTCDPYLMLTCSSVLQYRELLCHTNCKAIIVCRTSRSLPWHTCHLLSHMHLLHGTGTSPGGELIPCGWASSIVFDTSLPAHIAPCCICSHPEGCFVCGLLAGGIPLCFSAVLQTARVRSGVRALPQKTVDGAIPLAGKLPSSSEGHK